MRCHQAAAQLRSRLAAHGRVQSLAVSAFPAIELLWGRADAVRVRMQSYDVAPLPSRGRSADAAAPRTSTVARIAAFLRATAATGRLDARAGTFRAGRLVLDEAVLTKRGPALHARAVDARGADSRVAATTQAAAALRPRAGTSLSRRRAHPGSAAEHHRAPGHSRRGACDRTGPRRALPIASDADGLPRARGIRPRSVSACALPGGWLLSAAATLSER